MCSDYILSLNSCYLDNFLLISEVISKGMILGIIIGTVVGILSLFVKKINS